jgi:hypothetical protein
MSSALELLMSAQAALASEAAALAAQREALSAERVTLDAEASTQRAALAAERAGVAGLTAERELLTLNVGGTLLTTLRSTLASAEGSLLGALFSGRWDDSQLRDAAGNAFLDDDPRDFAALLRVLRAASLSGAAPCCDATQTAALLPLVDKYALRDHVWPVLFAAARVEAGDAGGAALIATRRGRAWRLQRAAVPQPPPVAPAFPVAAFGAAHGGPAFHQVAQAPAAQQHSRPLLLKPPFALLQPPLPPSGAVSWCVALHALSAGAVLGVATSEQDVHGFEMLAALLPFPDGPGEPLRGFALAVARSEVHIAGEANARKGYAQTLFSGLDGLRVGHTLRFVLSDAGDGANRILSITAEETDLAVHRIRMKANAPVAPSSLVLQLPAAPAWRFFAHLKGGDAVSVTHAVDAAHPETSTAAAGD